MKIHKIFLLLVIFCVSFQTIEAQTKKGETKSLYSTNGWDAPAALTKWMKLYLYRLLSNPGGYINLNQVRLDSLMNEMITFTDTTQLAIVDDTLRFASTMSGHKAFTTTAQTDTVSVPGLDSTSIFVVSVREVAPAAEDRLGVKLIKNKAVIMRPSSGTSGLKYNWIWIRRYE